MIKISPSILSADFAHLGDEIKRMEAAGADLLHIDVMDGHFVPNLTFGAPVIKCLRPISPLPFDVHLMIDSPEKLLDDFIGAGADILTVHYEASDRIGPVIERIREAGIKPCVSIKPTTPARAVFPLLEKVSMVLVMTVEPGFGGQKLIEDTLGKVSGIREECRRRDLEMEIQVDGGITPENIGRAARAGANVFVAGSAVFRAPDPALAVRTLRNNAARAV